MLRPRLGSRLTSNESCRVSASCRNGRATMSSRLAKAISSASTVTVPDSILDRSRMSLIRLSRSVPAPWMVRANSTCLAVRLPSGLSPSCWPEDQDAVERRAQLVRHVGEELGLVFRGQRQLGGLLLQRAARLLDFLILALHLDVALGELLRLLLELLVGLLQLALLRLQFAGELLRLLEQPFGLHRRLDAVEHDADAGGQLLEERHLQRGELAERGELDHRLDLAFEQHRQHDDVARNRLEQGRADRHGVRGHVGDQHAPLVGGALPDQALADRQRARDGRWLVVGISREQAAGSASRRWST